MVLLHKQVHDKKRHCRITACIAVRKGARGREEEGKGKEGITCKLNLEEYKQYILEMPQEA